MIKKIFNKYKEMPEEMKGAFWYTICNILQKIAPWAVMFILTHGITLSQYGEYSIFLSWSVIIEIIVTFRIYAGNYIAGLVQNNLSTESYIATTQKLCLLLITLWLCLYFIFYKIIIRIIDLDFYLILLMLISFYGTTSYELWIGRQRVENNYNKILIATFLYGIIGPILGALSVFFIKASNIILIMILIKTIIQLIIAIPFIITNIKKDLKKIDLYLIIETLKYNIPLVPYYFSTVLLNQADRLMIKEYVNYEKAGIYNVAYSIGMMLFIVSGALNLSLQTFLFKKLKNKDTNKKSNLIIMGTIIVAVGALMIILFSPEIILILGGKKYIEAIWIIPPVVISVLIMFIYQQFINLLFYFKKSKGIMFISIISAIINILLNFYYIPKYGYYAAGYTTFISYMLMLILYYFFTKKICKDNSIDILKIFDTKYQLIILLSSIIFTFFIMVFYSNFIIRSIICLLICLLIYKKKQVIYNVLGGLKS